MSEIVPSTISLTPARSVSCESSDTIPMPVDEMGTNSGNTSLPQPETGTGSLYLLLLKSIAESVILHFDLKMHCVLCVF